MSQAVACPRCGQPIRPTDQFCTRCGAENPDAGGEAAAMAEWTPSQGTAWDVVLERLRADTVGVYDFAIFWFLTHAVALAWHRI